FQELREKLVPVLDPAVEIVRTLGDCRDRRLDVKIVGVKELDVVDELDITDGILILLEEKFVREVEDDVDCKLGEDAVYLKGLSVETKDENEVAVVEGGEISALAGPLLLFAHI